jgi:hypothetical protein
MTYPKKRCSHRTFGLVIAVAAASPSIGCTATHEPPPPEAHMVIDASVPEDAPPPVDAFVLADAGPGPIDAGMSVDAQPDLDAGEPDVDAYYYPDGVRG